MLKNLMKFTAILAVALALPLLFTACEKEAVTSTEDVENYTDLSMFELQERSGCGRRGCFELVFPITVVFPDETTAEVEDYQDLRSTIREWKTDNPEATDRPTFAFPIELVTDEGGMISVENEIALVQLRRLCRRAFGPHRPGHGGRHCFRLTFPLDVAFPDGTVDTADRPRELQYLLREWRRDNPDAEGRPELVFPVTVKMQDGTEVKVASKEEMKALKASCKEEG